MAASPAEAVSLGTATDLPEAVHSCGGTWAGPCSAAPSRGGTEGDGRGLLLSMSSLVLAHLLSYLKPSGICSIADDFQYE